MKASLGATAFYVTVAFEVLGHHILRLNSVSDIQLSSTHITLFPSDSISSILRAYYYLSTKRSSVFAYTGIVLI